MDTSGKRSLLDRFIESASGRLLGRILDSTIFKIIYYALYVYNIADAIRSFPMHPRVSLTMIVISMAFLVLFIIFHVVETHLSGIWKTLHLIVGESEKRLSLFEKITDIVFYNHDLAESTRKTVESHERAHNIDHAILTLLVARLNTKNKPASANENKQLDAVPEELAKKDDKEPE